MRGFAGAASAAIAGAKTRRLTAPAGADSGVPRAVISLTSPDRSGYHAGLPNLRQNRHLNAKLGWREWLALEELGIAKIKAKVDTGARTSALHAFDVHEMIRDGAPWVRFGVHPDQHSTDQEIWCEAPILDKRVVRDSGGHEQERPVIKTPIRLGDSSWEIEMTLTNRDNMGFRVLLGRTAIRGRYLVDAGRSYLTGRKRAASKASS